VACGGLKLNEIPGFAAVIKPDAPKVGEIRAMIEERTRLIGLYPGEDLTTAKGRAAINSEFSENGRKRQKLMKTFEIAQRKLAVRGEYLPGVIAVMDALVAIESELELAIRIVDAGMAKKMRQAMREASQQAQQAYWAQKEAEEKRVRGRADAQPRARVKRELPADEAEEVNESDAEREEDDNHR